MTKSPIQILHLGRNSLRWATIDGGRRNPSLAGTGSLEGEPADCLERWIERRREELGEVFLFDGRPMYFTFDLRIPKKAQKQADNIIKLKIREELGLPDDAVCWSAHPEPGGLASDHVDLFTIVARRDSLDDLRDWKKRHQVDSLWVGADLTAIRSILSSGLVPAPSMILNARAHDATFYFADEHNRIVRDYAELSNGRTGVEISGGPISFTHAPAKNWSGAGGRISFGSPDSIRLFERAISELPARADFDATRLAESFRNSLLSGRVMEIAEFDAVVLGGILEAGVARPSTPSLLDEAPASLTFSKFTRQLSMRRLIPAAALMAFAFFVSLWVVRSQRESAHEKLTSRAKGLESPIQILRSQEAVLQKIKADRSPLIPVIEAIHKAAPEETTIMSLDIGESGVVQVAATARGENAATNFFKALSATPGFEKVQLANMKLDPQKQMVSFQLTWEIKGRKKR